MHIHHENRFHNVHLFRPYTEIKRKYVLIPSQDLDIKRRVDGRVHYSFFRILMELFKLSYGKMGRKEANLTATICLLCVESYIRGCNYNVTHKHDILCVLY